MIRVLVRGSGDIASAVAHRLFVSGYEVVLHDSPQPSSTRRGMAFTDAIFDGRAWLEGIEARLAKDISSLENYLSKREAIPIFVNDIQSVLSTVGANILVDARMNKHSLPESQIHLAALTIGLGPNFIAGETVHLAIETARGEALGKIIYRGKTSPLQGEPLSIEGHARDRYVYSPAEGIFQTSLKIGDSIQQGQEIARVNEIPLHAPIAGALRGLVRDGVRVGLRAKVIEVDPRAANAQIHGIAERPAKIAEGVLKAIQEWENAGVR